MRYRQVHLDFHTSGRIEGIGQAFDADAFGRSFRDAHVNSVTVFSKCHHGYSYHPTNVGEMHPHLQFDLLRAQIDALHAHDIKAPIYLTATWDELAAFAHPEWRTVTPEGVQPRYGAGPVGAGWAFLDFASPYLDYLCAQTEEVMENYPDGDGIFMDISFQLPSVSAFAQAKMEAMGLDWTRPDDVATFADRATELYFERVTQAVRKHNPNTPLFFNSGHIRHGKRDHYARFYTHLEVESLPTASWGYDHFPLSARYVDPQGIAFLGMTGKFHHSWGEVGGYKHPDALVYECGAMLAQGARCSIGDHLHPSGRLDTSTLNIIGKAYEWVEAREAWAQGTTNRAQIGLLSAESMAGLSLAGVPEASHHVVEGPDRGAVRVLLEAGFTFDVIDLESAFSAYELLILPDVIAVDAPLKARIEAYVAGGGRVLLTGSSGIDGQKGMVFDVGSRWEGRSPMSGGDYLLPVPRLQAGFVSEPLFMYQPSERITITDGEALGAVFEPYFDRAPNHFSGHLHTPPRPQASGYAAGSRKGAFTYMAHPIFSSYFEAGAVAMLEIAEKTIDLALSRPRQLTTSLPRAGRASLRAQPDRSRDVLHLLFANPAMRGRLRGSPVQPIQDLVALSDIAVSLIPSHAVSVVRSVPEGTELPFRIENGRLDFTVRHLRGHQMVEIVYG